MNWFLIAIGVLLILSPFGYGISILFKMTAKKRALIYGGLAACSALGVLLIVYATGNLPGDILNLICITSIFGGFIFLVTAGMYWRMRWYRHRYSQLKGQPNAFTKLFEQKYAVEDKNDVNE